MTNEPTPAFCARCRGVLPFALERRTQLRCGRCGTLYRRVDPGAELSRRSWRYLLYAGAGTALVSSLEGLAALLGFDHPASRELPLLPSLAMMALSIGCLVRSLVLRSRAGEYESLEPFEQAQLGHRLCPGMIRSDVVDGLFAAGWRPGKIRSAIGSLREVRPVRPSPR